MANRSFTFAGGSQGEWRVRGQAAPVGEALAPVDRLTMTTGLIGDPTAAWALRGITSNERYVERSEKDRLLATQQGLNRPTATYAALIPLRKNAAWWALTQDERRAVFESRSRHIEIGMRYLPPIARRLHHCRDISDAEPFDFLTWFEYAPADEPAFEQLLAELRASEEWRFVEREVDIRLVRDSG
jgi:chlorite dismutase